MSERQAKSNLGLILIGGGLFILCVTLFGHYFSKNPNFIKDIKAYPNDLRQAKFLQQSQPIPPLSCQGVAPGFIEKICALSETNPPPKWTSNLTAEQAVCFSDTHAELRQYMIDYRNAPDEHLSEYANDLSLIWFACEAYDEVSLLPPDTPSDDAYQIISAWFVARREDMLAIY